MFTGFWVLLLGIALAVGKMVEAAGSVFSYHSNSEFHPLQWGAIIYEDGTENQCNGLRNSPIDINSTEDCNVHADYTFTPGDCRLQDLTFSISDHGVKGTFPGADDSCSPGVMKIPTLPDATFVPIQFHIHTSSEHRMDGAKFGAELHIVHKQVDGAGDRLAVVGLFLQPDSPYHHDEFGQLLADWKVAQAQVETDCGACSDERRRALEKHSRELQGLDDGNFAAFDIYSLIPANTAYYHYDGGLTTPPCSEVVWWNVADRAVSISLAQFTELTRLILDYRDAITCRKGATIASASGSTSRPVQALNGRSVQRVCPTNSNINADDRQRQSNDRDLSGAATSVRNATIMMMVMTALTTITAVVATWM